jgi:hypothetical protein
MAQGHIPEEKNSQLHYCGTLKTRSRQVIESFFYMFKIISNKKREWIGLAIRIAGGVAKGGTVGIDDIVTGMGMLVIRTVSS